MKRFAPVILALALILLPFADQAFAHPGRTDANGGHYCRTNCAKWGLKTGEYHYHNSGGSAAQTKPSTAKPAPAPAPAPKPKPAAKPISVYIDGIKQNYDQSPVIDNGRTLVPMRAIFESLGASVNWDANSQTVTANRENTVVKLKIGSKSPTVNGKAKAIDVPAKLTNGRTLVPLHFVGEALGAKVEFDSANQAIYITQN